MPHCGYELNSPPLTGGVLPCVITIGHTLHSLCLVKGDHPNTPPIHPTYWFKQSIMDGIPMQMGYLISSYFNEDDGVFYETYEEIDNYSSYQEHPILLGPMTKQEFDSIEDDGWWLEDYLTINTPYPN